MAVNTTFLLMAEFGETDIPLEKVASKYLGLARREAYLKAYAHDLPFPVFRAGTQRSPWMVRITDLAEWLDTAREKSRREWAKVNAVTYLRD